MDALYAIIFIYTSQLSAKTLVVELTLERSVGSYFLGKFCIPCV